jgi:hypothetical protein
MGIASRSPNEVTLVFADNNFLGLARTLLADKAIGHWPPKVAHHAIGDMVIFFGTAAIIRPIR